MMRFARDLLVALVVWIVFAIITAPGCAQVVVLDCAKQEARAEYNNIVAVVEEIIGAAAGDPLPLLLDLERAAGDIVSCAVARVASKPGATAVVQMHAARYARSRSRTR